MDETGSVVNPTPADAGNAAPLTPQSMSRQGDRAAGSHLTNDGMQP
jgi:hypothetical protein